MTTVIRTVNFTLDHDVKKGEVINFNFPQQYPYFLALCEEMYKIAHIEGEVKAIPFSLADKAKQKMMKLNMNLAEKINKPTLDAIKQKAE